MTRKIFVVSLQVENCITMLIYNICILLYKLGVYVVSWFKPEVKKMRKGEKEAVEKILKVRKEGQKWVWVHAASLGEFEQGRPLIERIKANEPDTKILLSFFSPSGYEVRKNYNLADLVVYLPLDTPTNARRFVEAANPTKVYIIKYEFWLNYLKCLRTRGIETYIVSAIFRKNQVFFKWYGGIFRQGLKAFKTLYVQNEESKELLAEIGFNNVVVAGDTRFDRVNDIANAAKQLPIAEAFANKGMTLVVGSSWQPDEELLCRWINKHTEYKMIIAPHHVEENRIREIEGLLNRKSVRYTQCTSDKDVEGADVLIINTIGLLSSIYQYGSVAYIGGGFGVGIHNTLEAAVWGMPVVFGPNFGKFKEAKELISCQGGFSISTYDEMENTFDMAFSGEYGKNAADYVKSKVGASQLIIEN